MADFSKLIHHDPYELEIQGEKIVIHDGIFSPDPEIHHSTSIILNHLPDMRGKVVLDMGTGTGIIAIVCARNGAAKVVASDIDEKALTNTLENIERSNINNIQITKSDLYKNLKGTFDYIFANLPINEEIWNVNQSTVSLVEKFLVDSVLYLNSDSRIYLPWFSISDVKKIQDITVRLGYKYELITENKFGFSWYLLILSQK